MATSAIPTATWNAAMVLYAQGLRPQEIADRLDIPPSTLYSRISKGKWNDLLSITKDSTRKAVESVLKLAEFKLMNALANRFISLSESLPSNTQSNAKELNLQKELEPALRNAKLIFGWSDTNGNKSPVVRINLIGSASVTTEKTENRKESISETDRTPPPGGEPLSPPE